MSVQFVMFGGQHKNVNIPSNFRHLRVTPGSD